MTPFKRKEVANIINYGLEALALFGTGLAILILYLTTNMFSDIGVVLLAGISWTYGFMFYKHHKSQRKE